MLTIVDQTRRVNDPHVRALLAEALGTAFPERVDAACARYAPGAQGRLFGCFAGDALVGCVGFEPAADGAVIVHHIAVRQDWRGCGVGRILLAAVLAETEASALVAETDTDAVRFYRRCGFTTTSLGERYPGVERFRCVLVPDDPFLETVRAERRRLGVRGPDRDAGP